MAEVVENARKKPKGDKRSRTRSKLLAAARDLVREKGYEATTLEDIAQRAGMTTGAIYGNFRNRQDLFLAMSDAFWPPIVPSVAEGARIQDIVQSLAENTIAAVPERQDAAIGFLTGRAYALSHEEVRRKAQAQMAESYELGAEWLESMVPDADLPLPAETMVRVIHALTEGLLLQRLLAPDLMTNDVIRDAFGMLLSKADPS